MQEHIIYFAGSEQNQLLLVLTNFIIMQDQCEQFLLVTPSSFDISAMIQQMPKEIIKKVQFIPLPKNEQISTHYQWADLWSTFSQKLRNNIFSVHRAHSNIKVMVCINNLQYIEGSTRKKDLHFNGHVFETNSIQCLQPDIIRRITATDINQTFERLWFDLNLVSILPYEIVVIPVDLFYTFNHENVVEQMTLNLQRAKIKKSNETMRAVSRLIATTERDKDYSLQDAQMEAQILLMNQLDKQDMAQMIFFNACNRRREKEPMKKFNQLIEATKHFNVTSEVKAITKLTRITDQIVSKIDAQPYINDQDIMQTTNQKILDVEPISEHLYALMDMNETVNDSMDSFRQKLVTITDRMFDFKTSLHQTIGTKQYGLRRIRQIVKAMQKQYGTDAIKQIQHWTVQLIEDKDAYQSLRLSDRRKLLTKLDTVIDLLSDQGIVNESNLILYGYHFQRDEVDIFSYIRWGITQTVQA